MLQRSSLSDTGGGNWPFLVGHSWGTTISVLIVWSQKPGPSSTEEVHHHEAPRKLLRLLCGGNVRLSFPCSELSQGRCKLMGRKSCTCPWKWCDMNPKKLGLSQCVSYSTCLLSNRNPSKGRIFGADVKKKSFREEYERKCLLFHQCPTILKVPEE